MPTPFHATFVEGEAALRFPYDEHLLPLLRAIPGRRWDPHERVWRVPLEPEAAEALARLLAGLPAQVSEALERTLERRRRRRRPGECVIDRVRPNGEWWLGFATDAQPAILEALMEHPEAYGLPAIGRAMIPLDRHAAEIVGELCECPQVRLSEGARRALIGLQASSPRAAPAPARQTPRQPEWRGNLEVGGSRAEPVFLLLGDPELLPATVRERAWNVPGGVCMPLTLESMRLIGEGRLHGWVSSAARRCARALREDRPAPPAALELSAIHQDPTFVLAPGHDEGQLEAFATLAGALPWQPGRRAVHEHARLPAIRADPFCVPELDAFLAAHGTWVEPTALETLQEIREAHAHAEGLVALSAATAAPLRVSGLGGELKPFQCAAVSYALAQRRVFLADEQGLGKTIEALAVVQAAEAYPAVVVCPASLKLNWLRELERWLPGRGVRLLAGTRSSPLPLRDVTVVNYEILAARLPELRALAPRAVVLDESHYCKNAAAQRTQAAQRLAAAVPGDGLVLALTGTPVMNRPPELISQLRILGRLQEFGSGASFGRRFRGPDAHVRLHWHLRARCFVRRLKAEVLPQLPAKTRAVVPVQLDNEAEYRLAERDVVAWLRNQPLDLRELDARVAAALRAERLVRLNALKLLAARGKLHAALAWIHDFLSSGERLVVFAHHREIQRAVMERFPQALHVLGEDGHTTRDAAVRAFQTEDSAESQLIVCSIAVAGHGITLTRASQVAFLELDWTPAKHDQAEDRCHRIGQRDAVNASYLLAANTIDETIAALIERKRAVIGAVTDGREEDGEGVLDALVRELRGGSPYRHLRAVA